MIPYILHVTIIITCCFIFYKILLQRQTFYRLNRWMLITCLAVAFVLPKLTVPAKYSFQSAPAPVDAASGIFIPLMASSQPAAQDRSEPRTTKTVKPAVSATAPVPASTPASVSASAPLPASTPLTVSAPVSTPSQNATRPIILTTVLHWVYRIWLSGVIIFGASLLLQIIILMIRAYTRPVVREGRYRIVQMTGDHAPCSFGNNIYIDPSRYDRETYQQILVHEKVHASGWHTFDILLAECTIVLQWFNPFVWLYKKEVEKNLEFLTDQQVLNNPAISRAAYQLSLLRVSVPNMPLSITSNYNQSLLKRRIIMMNAHRSSIHTIWKYFFLLPLLTLLVCALNQPGVIAQTLKATTTADAAAHTAGAATTTTTTATPAHAAGAATTTTTTTMPAYAAGALTQTTTNTLAVMQPLTNNVNTTVADVHVAPRVQLEPLNVAITTDTARPHARIDRNEGSWFITSKDDQLWLELKGGDENHNWSNSSSVKKSDFTGLNSTGNITFTLKRDAGIVTFTGQFDGQQGFGHYSFKADPGYAEEIRRSVGVGDEELFSFFQIDIKREDVAMFKRQFPDIRRNEIISMAALHIDEPFIRFWRNSGYEDITEHRLITLKALNIDAAYVEDLRKAGYDKPGIDHLITFKSLKVDGAYIRSLNLPRLPPANDLITYRSLNVSPEYIESLKQAGYADVPTHDLITMKSIGIDGHYIQRLKAAGYSTISAHDLVTLKSVGIDDSYIQSLKGAGYNDIPAHDLVTFKSVGVDGKFIQDFRDLGYKNIAAHDLVTLKSVGVTADYVHKMRDKGFVSDDLQKYIRLKTADF